MKNFLLDYSLKVRLPLIIFVAAAAVAVTYFASYAERNSIGYQPEQPIAYSHVLHAGTMQIDCKYCHIGVEKSRIASVPSADICMNCHTLARTDKPEIIKLSEFFKSNTPIPWKRVHRIPEFAYFSHASHVTKGIDCINCHGDIKKTDVVGQVRSFTMGACLECHRNPEKNIENYSTLKNIKKGPEYCGACHR